MQTACAAFLNHAIPEPSPPPGRASASDRCPARRTGFAPPAPVLARWLLFATFSLTLAACGQPTHEVRGFDRYVQKFAEESARHRRGVSTDDLIVRFDQLEAGRSGLCRRGFGTTPTVMLDAAYWNTTAEPGREALIFHELGHCLLDQEHRNGKRSFDDDPDPVPVSIMNSTVLESEVYTKHREDYLNELFTAPPES